MFELVFPRLCGSLVTLRELTNDDSTEITDLLTHKISSFLWDVPPYTLESAKMFVRSSRADFKSFKAVHFAIDYKNKSSSDSFLIGCISLIGINHERKKASIGATWIGEEYWKRGIATECVELLLNYAFSKLGLKEVNAYAFPENKASIRMLEKNGMKRVRQFNKYYHVERRYRQLVEFLIYSKNCRYVYLRYPKRIILGLVRQLLTGFRMHVFSIRH